MSKLPIAGSSRWHLNLIRLYREHGVIATVLFAVVISTIASIVAITVVRLLEDAHAILKELNQTLEIENRDQDQNRLDEISLSLKEMGESFTQTLGYLQRLTTSLDTSTKRISQDVMDALSNLQFQDIVRQQLEQVIDGLNRLSAHMDELTASTRTCLVAPFSAATLDEHLNALVKGYAMHSQREAHARGTGAAAAGVASSAETNLKRVELF